MRSEKDCQVSGKRIQQETFAVLAFRISYLFGLSVALSISHRVWKGYGLVFFSGRNQSPESCLAHWMALSMPVALLTVS